MEEKYEGSEIVSPFMKKLDNFWYHYKWHSLIALFFVLVITVCSVQMCTREEYDIHILYAGPDDVKKTADAGLSDYRILYASLKLAVGDYDESGEVNPDLQTLFLPSAAEIDRINALARKAKAEGLTEAEAAERAALRREYIDSVVGNLKGHLDNTYFVDEQGNKTKLEKKGN